MFHNFVGINFLGKLHSTRQHIQFLQWIHDQVEIPESILASFLTSYSSWGDVPSKHLLESKKRSIQDQFNQCDTYMFEICSIKLYERESFQVQYELTNDYAQRVQTREELRIDLQRLCELIPPNKQIIFQVHFRPDIIHNDESKIIEKRQTIYEVVQAFCETTPNAFIYDPSTVLCSNPSFLNDESHFSHKGNAASFKYIYETFIK